MSENPTRQRSIIWYILPIGICVFGGVMAYFIIRQDDPSKAKNSCGLELFYLLAMLRTMSYFH